jgi:hypothetical protein
MMQPSSTLMSGIAISSLNSHFVTCSWRAVRE